jgi:hypothetical protein
MHRVNLKSHLTHILLLATSSLVMITLSFSVLEPTVSQAVTSIFSVRQQVSGEISFLVPAANVTMNGVLLGITGGTALGTSTFVVQTNQATGYTVDISFQNSPAMIGEVTNSTAIRNYGSSTEPTYLFFGSTSAQFAYTASSSQASDLDQSFLSNGSNACNTGASSIANTCWMGASTTNFRIINRSTSASNGATSSVLFKVNIPFTPIPSVSSDFYTATATLTAVTQ